MDNHTANISRDVDSRENLTCVFNEKHNVARSIVLSVIAVTTYFGNILILVSLRKYPKHFKGVLYTFIGQLAIADLLLAVGLTLKLVAELSPLLYSNKYFCLTGVCFISVSIMSSTKILLLISMDRFCAIMFPMKHLLKMSKTRRRRVVLSITWTISIVFGCVPVTLKFDLTNGILPFGCAFGHVIPDRLSFLAPIVIPLQFLINVVLCVIIAIRLKTNSMSQRKYHSSLVKCGFMLKVYVMYALCWTPYLIATIVKLSTSSQEKQDRLKCKMEYFIIPGIFNSGMNWIIYGLANLKFRKAFTNILFCNDKIDMRTNSYQVHYQNTRKF